MFDVHEDTTWWSPSKNTVIDARDISMLGVVKGVSTESYSLHVFLTGAGTEDKKEFSYNNLEDLNAVIDSLGLKWVDEPDV